MRDYSLLSGIFVAARLLDLARIIFDAMPAAFLSSSRRFLLPDDIDGRAIYAE